MRGCRSSGTGLCSKRCTARGMKRRTTQQAASQLRRLPQRLVEHQNISNFTNSCFVLGAENERNEWLCCMPVCIVGRAHERMREMMAQAWPAPARFEKERPNSWLFGLVPCLCQAQYLPCLGRIRGTRSKHRHGPLNLPARERPV